METNHGALNAAVARVLSDTRAAAGLTTRELAAKAEMDRVTMLRYLGGTRAISMETLYRLSTALGTTPHDVIARASAIVSAQQS